MSKHREPDAQTEALKAQAQRDREEAERIRDKHDARQSAEITAKAAADNLANVKQQWGRR